MRNRILLVGFAIVCAAACSKSGSTAPATNNNNTNNNTPTNTGNGTNTTPNTVNATTSDTFDPSTMSVAVGTTVSFVFAATAHNVTFNAVAGAPADIPGNNANTTITREFDAVGTFPYQCTIHSNMTGTITVH